MNRTLILLQILFFASCVKEEPCASKRVLCTHTIYYGYQACPDHANPGKWVFSNCKFYTETAEMTACDTSSWLLEARAFDESRKYEPNDNSWNEFTRLYPNQCGCN
jgi:hypothetical protein